MECCDIREPCSDDEEHQSIRPLQEDKTDPDNGYPCRCFTAEASSDRWSSVAIKDYGADNQGDVRNQVENQ